MMRTHNLIMHLLSHVERINSNVLRGVLGYRLGWLSRDMEVHLELCGVLWGQFCFGHLSASLAT